MGIEVFNITITNNKTHLAIGLFVLLVLILLFMEWREK